VVLEGVLHGRAMVHKKDTLSTAVDLLKVCICPGIILAAS